MIPESVAAERDRAGTQYAVLLRENGRPVALIQVSWSADYLGVSQFDEHARRLREFDFRVLDDPERLYWCGFRTWLPASPHDPEFFALRPTLTLSIGPDGQASACTSRRHRGGGSSVSSSLRISGELLTIAKVPFGEWWSYVGQPLFDPASAPLSESPASPLPEDGVQPAELPAPEAASSARYVLAGIGVPPEAPSARAADLSRYVDTLLVPLRSAETKASEDEPVNMPTGGRMFRGGLPRRPDLRFPDHDCALEPASELGNLLRHAQMLRQTTKAYDRALATYTRAVELDPDSTVALAGRGDTFRLLGRHEEALVDLESAVELFPAFSAAHICRARTLYALGRYAEALAAYDRFEEIGFTGTGSGFAPVIDKTNRGDICRNLGRYDEALTDFDRALAFSPDDAVALRGRGLTHQALGHDEEARADLTRAAELDSRLPPD